MQLKFTKKAEEVLNSANEIASELGHNYIGSEHLLLALSKVKNSVAFKALEQQNITSDDILEKIRELIGVGILKIKLQGDAFTPRTKRILNRSCEEALSMGTTHIGTEHILLAIVRESASMYGESYAVKILAILNVNAQKLYTDILTLLGETEKSSGIPLSNKKVQNQESNTPNLDKFSRNLNNLAKAHKFDPIECREKEIERVIQILTRRTKNNPCLVGDPGVGKTAIAEGLAQKIVSGNIPEILKDKKIISLDLSAVVAGSKYRGEFEDRVKKVVEEVNNANDVILFIDEIHTMIGAGGAEGAIDASSILKPALARGEIQIIGATTLDEYKKNIEKDSALERRFQPVRIEEPSEEDAIKMLKCLRDKYEAHHSVRITDEAIISSVKLSSRYINDRFLPDKAIDVLDEAASKVRLATFTMPPEIKNYEDELFDLNKEKEDAIKSENYKLASEIKIKESEIKEKISEAMENWGKEKGDDTQIVTPNEIADIITNWTGIPVKELQKEETERLKNMEEILHKKVIGQDEAVSAISKAIRRGRIGLKNPKRPIGSFLFLGPTGVGKTELSKSLSQVVFGNENSMIRVDMSEYMEKHSVSKMIGSPPGYVGYEEGGQLSEKIRKSPYSVLLFDEIEKAHPDVFNMLLQILDDGHITDSQGRKIDFKNTIIIMTSNAGARSITNSKPLGFNATDKNDEDTYKDIKKDVLAEVKKIFKPEFLNRIDDIIVFHQLSQEHVKEIAKIMIDEVISRVSENMNIELSISDEAILKIAEIGYEKAYGARPLRRAIQTNIEDLFAEELLSEKFSQGDSVVVALKEDKFIIYKE